MSLARAVCSICVVAMLLGVVGCNSYQYLRDPTPDLERMRYDYVRNNPGNKFNNDILVGRVKPGMSRLQVRVTWGDPDHVYSGDKPGIDQVWAYSEDEPSRGLSVFRLRFAGEVLENVDVSRNAIVLGTDADSPDLQESSRSTGTMEKPR
jgi:hypothetical protein